MKIALLGFGNVGYGAGEALASLREVEVKRVLVRRARACSLGEATLAFSEILDDPEIELVAEVMGGVEPARAYVLSAMRAGKHVVSANKELISRHYEELYAEAAKNGVCFRHTACAGGGVPWLFNLERAMRCDEITEVGGIMNGTTNFILHAMERNGAAFSEALKSAQALGLAEAEPSADVDGTDAARKCAISANFAFGAAIHEAEMNVEGIRFVRPCDIEFAKSRGMALKLLARAARRENAVSAYVEPRFVHGASGEAAVPENYNLLSLTGKRLGKQSFFGQGAGTAPTGVAVAQDILDVARGEARPPSVMARPLPVCNDGCAHRYYVRANAEETGRALADLSREQFLMGESRAYITRPVSVFAMHALAKKLREDDPQLFFAGMDEA